MRKWIVLCGVLLATQAHAFGVRATFGRVEGADSYRITAATDDLGAIATVPQEVGPNIVADVPGLTGTKATVSVVAQAGALTSDPSNSITVAAPTSVFKVLQPGRQGANSGFTIGPVGGAISAYPITSNATSNYLTLKVTLPAGTWNAYGRFYYPVADTYSNSFFISVDGGANKVFGNSTKYQTWHWDGVGGAALSLGALTAGTHTLRISPREVKTGERPVLDLLYLTTGGAPTDAEAASILTQCAVVFP